MSGTETTVNMQSQINLLSETMQRGFQELKELLQSIEQRVRTIETSEARCQPMVFSKIDAAWRKIDEHEVKLNGHERKLAEINDLLQSLRQTNKILTWLGVVLGGTALIWLVNSFLELVMK